MHTQAIALHNAKQKHQGAQKSSRSIRSNIVIGGMCDHKLIKTLISAETKKLLYQNYFYLLEWHTTIVYSIFSQVRLALATFITFRYEKMVDKANHTCKNML